MAMLTGCISSFLEPKTDQTDFYVIRPAMNVSPIDIKSNCDINMLNVVVPSYMERNQIVMLNNSNVEISELNQWAESPMDGIERALQDNLTRASDKFSIYTYPGVSFQKDAIILRVFVSECIGKLGGNLIFKGRWQMAIEGSPTQLSEPFSYTIPCGDSCVTYVEAINVGVYNLSQDIAKALVKFQKIKSN